LVASSAPLSLPWRAQPLRNQSTTFHGFCKPPFQRCNQAETANRLSGSLVPFIVGTVAEALLAATLQAQDVTYAWLGAITKVEKTPDGTYIYGKATDDSVDADEQIVDADFARKALAEWFSTFANVRQMHSTNMAPAGRGVSLEDLPDGQYVKSKIVEPTAIKLVDEGVYQGYSVGISRPRIVRDSRARGGRIVDGKIVELSVVDRPANTMAKFQIAKMAGNGTTEFVGKTVTLDSILTIEPVVVTRFQKGAHVTVHARDGRGAVNVWEGRVTRRGQFGSVELDTNEYGPGGFVRLEGSDIVAAYKGSVPDIYKGNSTEESVTDESQPDVSKAETLECDACGGTGNDGKCDKCGGSGKVAVTKGADMASITEDVGDIKEDIKDLENDIEDVSGVKADDKDDDKDPDDGDDDSDAGDDDDSDSDAPVFGKDKGATIDVRKGYAVVLQDGAYKVTKGPEVLGSHALKDSAIAQRDSIIRSNRADKAAAKAAAEAAETVTKSASDEEGVAWLARRAHDYTCPAYKTEAVTDAYPLLEKGLSVAVGPSTRDALFASLAGELGVGAASANLGSIASLGKALQALGDLAAAASASDEDVLGKVASAARDEMNEAFKSANPQFGESGGPALPSPSDSITPGQFTRPYIGAGHQRETASATAASIPTTTHPISASDFTRGPLTEGHQRYLVSKMVDLHDGLTAWKPELCRMSAMDAQGSFASDRQPAGAMVSVIPNGATNAPVTTSASAGANMQFPQPAVKSITQEELQLAITKALEPHLTKITTLQQEVDRLGAQPDQGAAPYRGIAVASSQKVARISEAEEAQQSKAERKQADRVEYLRSVASGGDPASRIQAQEALARMGIQE
jgi:hypothetical protein